MDQLGALNAFMHAAASRSFTAAGRALGISSSAVGKAISRLEMRHGVKLFHRNTRSIITGICGLHGEPFAGFGRYKHTELADTIGTSASRYTPHPSEEGCLREG
jgi:hypothetical protein